jgi:hypothetical protein
MEDIVAVAITLEDGARRYFLTWGRIQDPVDPEPLEQIILERSTGFSLGGKPVRAELCVSLQEAAKEPYFYECYFSMCQAKRPNGKKYDKWQRKIDELMRRGKQIWYLGRPFLKKPIETESNPDVDAATDV